MAQASLGELQPNIEIPLNHQMDIPQSRSKTEHKASYSLARAAFLGRRSSPFTQVHSRVLSRPSATQGSLAGTSAPSSLQATLWNRIGNRRENISHIDTGLGTGFEKQQTFFLRISIGFLGRHFAGITGGSLLSLVFLAGVIRRIIIITTFGRV